MCIEVPFYKKKVHQQLGYQVIQQHYRTYTPKFSLLNTRTHLKTHDIFSTTLERTSFQYGQTDASKLNNQLGTPSNVKDSNKVNEAYHQTWDSHQDPCEVLQCRNHTMCVSAQQVPEQVGVISCRSHTHMPCSCILLQRILWIWAFLY